MNSNANPDRLNLTVDESAAIHSALTELGWIAPEQHILSLSPAGEGNMNRTLRVNLTDSRGKPSSLVLKQAVPFVAKYPDIPAPIQRCRSEADFYRVTSGTAAVAQCMPRLFGFDPERHLLCFEDLGAAGDFTDLYQPASAAAGFPSADAGSEEPLPSQALKALLTWLGNLHSLPLEPGDWPTLSNLAMRELNHQHIFELPLAPDNDLELDQVTPGLSAEAQRLKADAELVAATRTLGALYLAPVTASAVLLHGDFYPGSWLRGERNVWVIDPEFGFFGPREFDLGVFIAHAHFAQISTRAIDAALNDYATACAPNANGPTVGFDRGLAEAFAGVEIMRRLLGVAQLPLEADLAQKRVWLDQAETWLARYEH